MNKTKEEIAQLLKNIQENDAIAKAEFPPIPGSDLGIFQRTRINAQERFQNYRAEYALYVESHLGGIFLKGDRAKQAEFAKIAEEMGKTITFDTNEMYEKISNSAFIMLGGKGGLTADQLALMFAEIRHLSRHDLGITRLREPNFQWMFSYSWNTNESLAEGIRKSLFDTNGIRLTLAALVRKAQEESLAHPNSRTTIPVVVLGMKPPEEKWFEQAFGHGYIFVDVDAVEVNEENVKQAFIELRDLIKTKTTP